MSRIDLQHLTGIADHGAIISTVVEGHEQDLTLLRFQGGLLRVPRCDLSIGSKIRVHIKARNVAIALKAPARTSFRNILPARVEEIAAENGSLVDVRLDIGSTLLARIAPSARQSLDLKPGREVFALIKSVAVLTGNLYLEEG